MPLFCSKFFRNFLGFCMAWIQPISPTSSDLLQTYHSNQTIVLSVIQTCHSQSHVTPLIIAEPVLECHLNSRWFQTSSKTLLKSCPFFGSFCLKCAALIFSYPAPFFLLVQQLIFLGTHLSFILSPCSLGGTQSTFSGPRLWPKFGQSRREFYLPGQWLVQLWVNYWIKASESLGLLLELLGNKSFFCLENIVWPYLLPLGGSLPENEAKTKESKAKMGKGRSLMTSWSPISSSAWSRCSLWTFQFMNQWLPFHHWTSVTYS